MPRFSELLDLICIYIYIFLSLPKLSIVVEAVIGLRGDLVNGGMGLVDNSFFFFILVKLTILKK